ncbi:MAG: TetR/AcrR family transcriptional regulator [Muribaculaceae bacterium]|nr:TetR/AcrR family transcriptional regulator [Bacteroides sp.]MDE6681104.1 TetR/AcrR family transcriptional regulator [Muribaculaceae bacterium]MDE6843888.1 TetR/AcrR family transcriptional regulator [Muribaculaceae bacterium]MDE7188997.1 TetR/AcrR family transcriptional regulator [Muribaculaceae bacterium]
MHKDTLPPDTYAALAESIMDIIYTQGPKAATMDYVAAKLQMSKRTLYEIFGSKEDMIIDVVAYDMHKHHALYREIFNSSPDVLVALTRIFRKQRDLMARTSPRFFRDMDNIYHKVRDTYDHLHKEHEEAMLTVFNKGVEQGMFRPGVNYRVLNRLMKVQMESLKRMEEVFPPDITLVEAYDTISMGLLHSIATPEGMAKLNLLVPDM